MNGYDVVVNEILDRLRDGAVPWRSGCNAVPRNYITGHAYRGINRILLSWAPYELPWYLSFKQVSAAGGTIRKGEHGHIVCFFKKVDDEDRAYDMVLKYYRVFNIAQTTLEPKLAETRIPSCESVYANMPDPPLLSHNCGIPHYAVVTDTVALPVPGLYERVEEYYSTLFHELIHSTGHPKRLMRFGNEEQTLGGKESYSLEELVAEIGASFLCAETGILPKTIASNAAYIDNWLRVLENNRSYIFRAASAAQKAADYITSGGSESCPLPICLYFLAMGSLVPRKIVAPNLLAGSYPAQYRTKIKHINAKYPLYDQMTVQEKRKAMIIQAKICRESCP